MSDKLILDRPADHVARVTIDNPPSNALGLSVREPFLAMLDEIEADLSIRCLIITGTGRAFCSGDDLREAHARGGEGGDALKQFGRLLMRVESMRMPVIAAVNGPAVGGGLELALCCDIRMASPDAKFIAAGVNVGLMASVVRLPRLIGVARAKRMLLTGSTVAVDTALQWGLITDLIPAEGLASEAVKLATRIATRAPLSVEAAKRQSTRALDHSAADAHAESRAELETLQKSADHKEGVAAFAERREPKFTRS